jgi:hypothetical protein
MNVPFGSLSVEQRLQSGSVAVIFGDIALGFYSKRISKVGVYASAVMQVVRTILIFQKVIGQDLEANAKIPNRF